MEGPNGERIIKYKRPPGYYAQYDAKKRRDPQHREREAARSRERRRRAKYAPKTPAPPPEPEPKQ